MLFFVFKSYEAVWISSSCDKQMLCVLTPTCEKLRWCTHSYTTKKCLSQPEMNGAQIDSFMVWSSCLQIIYACLYLKPVLPPHIQMFPHSPKQTIPGSYFLLAAGVGCLWASPASPCSAAGPGSPGISPLPRCILDTPEPGVSPCLLSVRGPWLHSVEPLSQIQPNAGEARRGRWPAGAWRRGGKRKGGFWLVRATLEECFQMIAG